MELELQVGPSSSVAHCDLGTDDGLIEILAIWLTMNRPEGTIISTLLETYTQRSKRLHMLMLEKNTDRSNALDIALMFKALGDPTRLKIFEFLRAQCCPVAVEETGDVRPVLGPTVGEVCCSVTGADKITSSVSFHIKELRLAGLVTVERRGKNQICGVNQAAVRVLADYLSATGSSSTNDRDDCC